MEIRLASEPDALSVASLDSVRRLRIHRVFSLDAGAYRVRSVLDPADKGVRESYWLGHHGQEESVEAQLVHYRVRGVSDAGKSSKWVYSNLMTDEGEDILFQLLSDLADTLDWMDDPSIEYMMSKFLDELYKNDWLDKGASPERVLEQQEQVKQAIAEIVELFGEHTKTFREIVRAEPEELAMLFKVYGALDTSANQIKDELFQVFYGYIEDQIDWLDEESSPMAFGSGGNPFAVLSEVFDIQVLQEAAKEAWELFPEDHVHFRFRDLVSLSRDPVVFEKMAIGQTEAVLNTFLFSLSILWALPEDRLSMDLANLVEDISELEGAEHQMILEHDGHTDILLEDILRLVFEQTGQENDLDVPLTAFWLTKMNDAGLRLHVDTGRHERVTSRVNESVSREDETWTLFNEALVGGAEESVDLEASGDVWNLERSVVGFLERVLRESEGHHRRHELKQSTTREYAQLLAWPRIRKSEQVSQKIEDGVNVGFSNRLIAIDNQTLGLLEHTINRWALRLMPSESLQANPKEERELFYATRLDSSNKNRTKDKIHSSDYSFNGHDRFQQEEKERQQYTFDELDERYGLGSIQLGNTTL
ncbi:hypothetical protein C0431_13210 [bacterium]|nr:hypothetical protein [bacterium]